MLAIRITQTYAELKPMFERVLEVSDKVIVYEHHDAARVHVHGLLVGCRVSTDTLKNWVKRALGVNAYPKTDWTFKTAQDNNLITYMSKGILDPILVRGFSEEEVNDYRSKWVQKEKPAVTEKVQFKLKIENPAQQKIRQNEMMDMVKRRCVEKGLSKPSDVLREIREVVYVEYKTVVGRYKIRDFYDYVMSDLSPDRWLAAMEKLCSYNT